MSVTLGSYDWYIRAADHPMKGRIISCIEKLIFPDNGLPCLTDGDIWMRLHPKEYWEAHMLKGGHYHSAIRRFMENNLKQRDIVVIAGVSFGQQVILASRIVGERGRVVAVDPHPAALIQIGRASCRERA